MFAIITGSNTGIGFAAARLLLSRGTNVLLACRSLDRANAAAALLQPVAADGARCSVDVCDLSDLRSVRNFAQRFSTSGNVCDILINNAGVGFAPGLAREDTVDGFESVMGCNHLGHFLLTNLLLDRMSEQGKIVNVTSSLHDPGARRESKGVVKLLDLERYGDVACVRGDHGDKYNSSFAYKSKIVYGARQSNKWRRYELQRRLLSSHSKVVVNAVSPGFIPSTELNRRSPFLARIFLKYVLDGVMKPFTKITRTVEEGGTALVDAATSDVATAGGCYLRPSATGKLEAVKSSERSYDVQLARRVWDASEVLVGMKSSD